MDWSTSLTTRPLDREGDWTFYLPHEAVGEHDLAAIRPLLEESARVFWTSWVSAKPPERHPMLLGRGHWLDDVVASGPNWRATWSDPPPGLETDPVATFLSANFAFAHDEPVVFVWMRERAALMPWVSFLRTWRAFLYSDEAPFVMSPVRAEFASFGPHGQVRFGRRVAR